jgi:hypothetical protein
MEEKRKAERLKKENEVNINIVSEDTFIPAEEWSKLQELNKYEMSQEGDTFIPIEERSRLQELNKTAENSSKEKTTYNCSADICLSGAKIQGNILLPVDSIIKIDITLNNLEEKITTLAKVKWNKVIIENGSYEAGVEFVDAPDEEIQKLYELGQRQKDNAFISEKEWSNLQELNKYEMPEEGDTFIPVNKWSKPQEINKNQGEVFISKQINMTIETVGSDMKSCRYCSREIRSDAVKCEHCGRTLSERTTRKVFI